MSFDVLQDKIRAMKNPTVAGLDPKLDYIPSHIFEKQLAQHGPTLRAAAEAICEFNCGLIDALCDIVPAVKPQSAYYEVLGSCGVEALERTIQYAKSKDLFVIADIKRGDIGSTAAAYSQAYLDCVSVGGQTFEPFPCDAVTVNAYLGSDGLLPFLETCKKRDKSIFALVKTSNPSSGELQDLVAGDRFVYTVVGDLISRLGQGTEGRYGFSQVGAVVGATYPMDLRSLRRRLEHVFFLVPGYGAQGGSADDVRHAFNQFGHGAVINSSRGILCAWQKTGKNGTDYQDAARAAALQMRDDLRRFITIV
jgi:orotidine-5'-phosphate decarboxylase